MSDEPQKAFKRLIDKACFDSIYSAVSNYISYNFDNLDLAERSNIIEEVQSASLEDMEIQRIANLRQDDEVVKFDVIVSCEIEIEETVRRDRQVDASSQWFSVSCSAVLDGTLQNFKVQAIEVYSW